MKKLSILAMITNLPDFSVVGIRQCSTCHTDRVCKDPDEFLFLMHPELKNALGCTRRTGANTKRTISMMAIFILFVMFAGMWEFVLPSREVFASELSPVQAVHSPHIRQWWQFWGQKEAGKGRASLRQPVYIRFRTDQLGTHVGRLYLEFSGDLPEDANGGYRVHAIAVPHWGGAPQSTAIPLERSGKKVSGSLTVSGFGSIFEDVYLSVEWTGSYACPAEFRYGGIFVFEESVGGEDVPWTALREGVRPKNDEKVGFEVFGIPSMDEQETQVAPKVYNMRNPWQKTTTMVANETRHGWWEWQWGDGEVTYDRDSLNTVGTVERIFTRAGEYIVKAISYAETGEKIREMVWHFVLDATSVHLPQSFNFETIGLVNPEIEIIGPLAWVTGRPAQYRVTVDFVEPPFGETVITSIKPSENFQMVWDKPGKQTLTVAVAAVTTYKFPKGGQISVRNVYTRSIEVEVATLAISE